VSSIKPAKCLLQRKRSVGFSEVDKMEPKEEDLILEDQSKSICKQRH
jgi:hypothetical protein